MTNTSMDISTEADKLTRPAPFSGEGQVPNAHVYRYGLQPPTEAADEVREQMRLAHRYRNTLVEIERGRRAAVQALISAEPSTSGPEAIFAAADLALEDARRAAASAKSTDRLGVAPELLRNAVIAARAVRRDAANALHKARREAQVLPHVAAEIDLIADRAKELRRSARKHCGVFWGTYLLIEDADQASRQMPLYDDARPNAPRFVRWEGEGRVGVQVQKTKPLSLLQLYAATDTRVRIEPGAPLRTTFGHSKQRPDPTSRRSAKRQRYVLALRIGSESNKSPRWARFPMLMHRPFPEGAQVKYVTVQLRMVGPREEWSVLFTLDLTAAQGPSTRDIEATNGRVAIDVGWRVVPEGLRVAAWRDEAGNTGALILSGEQAPVPGDTTPRSKSAKRSFNRRAAGIMGQFRKSDGLQAIRKTNFNDARRNLAIHLTALDAVMPPWLRDATKYLGLWKSQSKLAALARRWRDARFDGDAEAYDALEAWRYHDHHLWEWETSQRVKSLRYRRELYRCFAAKLATRYSTIVLEAFDLRRIARLPVVEADETENETARSSRVVASTSELRGCLLNAFRGRGGTVEFVDPALTTKTCAACGSVEQWDQAKELRHACGACKAEWDQDDNAAANILVWPKRTGGPAKKRKEDPAHPGETRWVRAKRLASEKKDRRAAALAASPTNIAEPSAAE